MKRPLWTHVWFAALLGVGFVALAVQAMRRAVLYSGMKTRKLGVEQLEADNVRAVLFLVLAMLLVAGAIVVPLVVRRKAHLRLKELLRKATLSLVAVALLGAPVNAAEKGEAGKRRVLELTRFLEKHPLADKDKSQRSELLEWWVSAPVTLSWCSDLLVDGTNEKARPIVVTQGMFGAGARLLEAGKKSLSAVELATAGVESALAAYRNALKADRSYADKLYDELAADPAKRKAYIARRLEQCDRAGKK